MNSLQFLNKLISSYTPDMRPDADYVEQISDYLSRHHFVSQELEEAYETIRVAFRRFPSISDIAGCLGTAHQKSSRGSIPQKAWEFFEIDGYPYRRDVTINSHGEIERKPLPCGAVNYMIHFTDPRMVADREWISLEQAINLGYVDRAMSDRIKMGKIAFAQGIDRFEKIGRIIKEEPAKAEIPEEPFDDINDSMASNPETPNYGFEDL